MSRSLQMFTGLVAVVALVSVTAFLYLTQEISAPSLDIIPNVQTITTSGSVGDTYTFQLTGDLTIAGVTYPATFTVTATLQEAGQLTGHAEILISRTAFNLEIPDGDDAVTVKLDFVTKAD